MCRQGTSGQEGDGLWARALEVECLGWARGCKGNVISHGRNDGGGSGIRIAHKAVGYQCIWRLREDSPYTMVTWLVEEVQSWVIRNVDCGLVQVS